MISLLPFLNLLLAGSVSALIPYHPQRQSQYNTRSSTSLQLVDPSAVTDLAQGLNSAFLLGDVDGGSVKDAVNMKINDGTILLGGGVAAVSLGGLAAFLNMNKNDDDDNKSGSIGKESQEIERNLSETLATLQSATSSTETETSQGNEDEDDEGEQTIVLIPAGSVADIPTTSEESTADNEDDDEGEQTIVLIPAGSMADIPVEETSAIEEDEDEGEQTIVFIPAGSMPDMAKNDENNNNDADDGDPSTTATTTATDVKESKQRGIFMQRILDKKSQLLQKANQKLRGTMAKLTTAETKLQETKSQLSAVTRSNQKLYNDYQTEKNAVLELQKELEASQQQLTQLEESTETQLSAMREANADLEDQFELAQNDKMGRISALRDTEWSLDRTSQQLSKTKKELQKTKMTLDETQSQMATSNQSLETLQNENQSLRKLTGNMWTAVKGKVSRRRKKENEDDGKK